MGNSCSSGQGHKDKDNMSQRSEESPSYQITCKKPSNASEKQLQTTVNNVPIDNKQHSGIILEPSTAGQQGATLAPQDKKTGPLKVLKGVVATSSISDSMSLSSPPAVQSPRDFDKLLEPTIPVEVQQLADNLQNLLMGRVTAAKTHSKTNKIVIYVSAADSQDCCVEKGSLHNTVYPQIRAYCRERGYELHIVDLHWKTFLEKQQDHEFPELCLGELTRQSEVAYTIPVLFLNNSLGTPLLPITIESQDFKMAMDSAENQTAQSLLSKWYQLDSAAQPPCYRLQPISSHIPGFKENSLSEREKALGEWRSEIERMLNIMVSIFPQELRDTYLTTVVEQEVHNTVLMSQELAKRCIWINRIYTPGVKTPDNISPGELELQRRLNNLQNDLRNQLSEKHIVRLPVRYVEGGLNLKIPDHQQYIEQVTSHLTKHLTATIDSIIDEHQNKTLLKPSYGVSAQLFEELNQQTGFCQRAAQCSVNREKVLNDIKNYITGENRNQPLVIVGSGGCGKTTLLAKIGQCCQQWVPEAFLIFRFVGISAQSSTTEQILCSIANQCSVLIHGHQCFAPHNITSYKEVLPKILSASCLETSPIIILDGIDQVKDYGSTSLEWLPEQLPQNIKLILSVTENSRVHKEIASMLSENCFIKMPLLGDFEARTILMSSVMQYNHSVNSKIQDCVLKSVQECTLPLYAKVLAWQTSWWGDKDHDIVPKGHVRDQLTQMLEELELIVGKESVEHALALLVSTKLGINDSEMLDLLAFDEVFQSKETYVSWAPACLFWARLTKHLGPFLQWTLTNEGLTIQWRDKILLETVRERYKKYEQWANEMLHNYFTGHWWNTKPGNVLARLISQDVHQGKCYNRRKLEELPYQYYRLKGEKDFCTAKFITDLDWIYDKICGTNCFQVLEDINLTENIQRNNGIDKDVLSLIRIIKGFLENSAVSLNYDGRQFYSQLNLYLEEKKLKQNLKGEGSDNDLINNETLVEKMIDRTKRPPVISLLPVTIDGFLVEGKDPRETDSPNCVFEVKVFDIVTRLNGSDNFVATVSTEKEEISVWDVRTCTRVRTLLGVTHPINLITIDQYRCIVLCRRELRIYDLNEGAFVSKLKGVMNQKMPYYGLHDENHIVALSRNRMYVNLMNLTSGDCVTTFKAGEDRFLNSLLVSGDGRVLVCGDETQKPFPLLVWNLTSKKLMYDLRIPHHDFITSLSAITYEGNYVCCVCHEIDEPAPNFIVVYDLQSGTLFKKWKPSCNTVSLEISSQEGCVISGLEDARILVWDLITGNCRWSLQGHTAPVNLLRLDSDGSCFLSSDSGCRDRSIRLWDLHRGNLMAVFTPREKVTACELTRGGKYIVLALQGQDSLVTLKLIGSNIYTDDGKSEQENKYGKSENCGKVFDLKEDNC